MANFVAQANIAHGPQQVNYGKPTGELEKANQEKELLEQQHGERLDFGAPETAVGSDSQMEAVGAVNGTADG